MIAENQPTPRPRGAAPTTVEDLLLDAAVITALEATGAGNTDEALAILDMAVEMLAEPIGTAVTVLPARPAPPARDEAPLADVLEFRPRRS